MKCLFFLCHGWQAESLTSGIMIRPSGGHGIALLRSPPKNICYMQWRWQCCCILTSTLAFMPRPYFTRQLPGNSWVQQGHKVQSTSPVGFLQLLLWSCIDLARALSELQWETLPTWYFLLPTSRSQVSDLHHLHAPVPSIFIFHNHSPKRLLVHPVLPSASQKTSPGTVHITKSCHN